MRDKADLLGRYAAIALGASIPISVALDNVLFVLVLLAWFAGGGVREKVIGLRANPAALAALAFLGLLLLGMAWGPGSAKDGWYYVGKYKDLVLVAALSGLALTARDQRFALEAFLGAMALALVLSYAMWLGLVPMEEPSSRGRANPAVFKLHITHGILMALAAFLAANRALSASDLRWRAVYVAGAVLAAVNVFMVQGRTGYLVFGVLALYFCAVHWRRRGVLLAALAATVGGTFALVVEAPLLGRIAAVAPEYEQWQAGRAADTSTGLRMNYYKTTAAIVRDHPVLGVGTGGFVHAYREKIRGTNLPESNNPHNQYLLTAAQLGTLGLAALIAMFAIMWWQAGQMEPAVRMAVRGLILTIAVGSFLNSLLIDHTEGLLFAWMAGVLFATPRRPK